jgi:DNA-binding transcriptional regulator/RsmH inhibitor MraZ
VYEKEALKVKEKTERRSGRRIARATFGKADIQTLDSAGRLLLSLALREHAGLDQGDSVTVLGMGDNIEIWQHDRWLVEEPLAMAALKRDEEEDGIES